MISLHDFENEDIYSYHEIFLKKMRARFMRLKKKLKDSRDIIFLSARNDCLEEMSEFLHRMNDYHNASYTLINIAHSPNLAEIKREVFIIDENLKIIQYYFDDSASGKWFWIGNYREWSKVMRTIYLK